MTEWRSEKRAPHESVRSLLELIRLCYWAWSAGDARGPKGNRLASVIYDVITKTIFPATQTVETYIHVLLCLMKQTLKRKKYPDTLKRNFQILHLNFTYHIYFKVWGIVCNGALQNVEGDWMEHCLSCSKQTYLISSHQFYFQLHNSPKLLTGARVLFVCDCGFII